MFFCVRASQWELVGEEIPNAAAFSLISGITYPKDLLEGRVRVRLYHFGGMLGQN